MTGVNLKNILVVRKDTVRSSPAGAFPDRSTGAIWDYLEKEVKVSPVRPLTPLA
jgi:hypothetical protein